MPLRLKRGPTVSLKQKQRRKKFRRDPTWRMCEGGKGIKSSLENLVWISVHLIRYVPEAKEERKKEKDLKKKREEEIQIGIINITFCFRRYSTAFLKNIFKMRSTKMRHGFVLCFKQKTRPYVSQPYLNLKTVLDRHQRILATANASQIHNGSLSTKTTQE